MYGQGPPYPPGYGVPSTDFVQGSQPGGMIYGEQPGPPREAVVRMPNVADMAGSRPMPWVRYPYYPTAPFYSTDPNVGYQTRFYSQGLTATDADYAVGGEAIRIVQFDLPVRLVAINGACTQTNDVGLIVGQNPLDQFLFRLEYTQGDRLHVAARLGSTVVGTAERPGELGGTGWTIDQGAAVVLGITPRRTALRIDIVLVCLEMRGPRNYTPGR